MTEEREVCLIARSKPCARHISMADIAAAPNFRPRIARLYARPVAAWRCDAKELQKSKSRV